ncbi:MAG: OsmC family protein [Planctomycetota bacterium]
MVTITARYEGDLRCVTSHGPSGASFPTDAPADNQGLGQSFSPTDLVATGLATCVMTILGILARRDGIDLRGMTASVEKHMVADPHRRIARLPMTLTIPTRLDDEHKKRIERAAHLCPVKQSLRSDIDMPITFVYTAEV